MRQKVLKREVAQARQGGRQTLVVQRGAPERGAPERGHSGCDAPQPCPSLQCMDRWSDGTVVGAVLDGESAAFAELVRRHQDAQYRFAVRMLGDRDDADDALQSAFVRAYRGLSDCREPERFGAWLRRIVLNECRTLATRQRRREKRFDRDEGVFDRMEDPEGLADPFALERVEQALGTLNLEHREAFVLKYVEELSYEEMADATGAGVSALKMRVKRACEQLREQLQGVRNE